MLYRQPDWRFCFKCQGYFHGPGPGGVCPAGGAHDGSESDAYVTVDASMTLMPSGEVVAETVGFEGEWAYCQRCSGLFSTRAPERVCPAGGDHDPADSGAYFVYYDSSTHRVYTIDGRETAPAAATAGLFIDPATGKPLPFPTAVTSGLSVGVPGMLMTWQRAVKRWGNFTLADDLAPATQVARRGFRVTPTLREQVRENAFLFDHFSSTSALFLPHGQLPVVGSIMKNPALARTYGLIARNGIQAFYGGAIGRDLVATVHNLPLVPGATLVPRPGLMTLADLSNYRAPLVAPTHVRYRGYDVYSMAPSSSGGTTVTSKPTPTGRGDRRHRSRASASAGCAGAYGAE